MIYPIRRHPNVESDILEAAEGIARDSVDASFRFLAEIERAILSLRHMPGRGSPKRLRGRLSGVRTWSSRAFPNHLVLYEIRANDVYIFAVLHGRRNLSRALKERGV